MSPSRVPNDHPLARTFALLDADLAASAAAGMRGTTDLAEVEGLVEVLLNREATAATCAAALRSLAHDTSALVSDTIVRVLTNQHPTIRIHTCAEVERRELFDLAADRLVHLIGSDPFWQVRRAAVSAIAADPSVRRWRMTFAATDPHWRVRYSLAQVLAEWGRDESGRATVLAMLPESSADSRVLRLRDYLAYRWTDELPPERPTPDPAAWCPFWDWDPAVLARNIGELGKDGRRESLDVLTRLANHADERVRGWVITALRDSGESRHWADALTRLGDPREDTSAALAELVKGLELDRIEAVAKFILSQEKPDPAALAWAARQLDDAFPAEEVQADLERLGVSVATPPQPLPETGRGSNSRSAKPLPAGWGGVDLENHPYVRAASLTPERAEELVANPTLETSWFVLAQAAKMCRVPIWKLAPETEWKPAAEPREPSAPLVLPEIALVRPRQIGPGGPVVSPLGVSGHYGLPVEGFARAVEAGVNFFFWEPNYATLTRFVTRLSTSDRTCVHVLAGTFEAHPAKIRKDVDRALKNLKLDRLSVFLIFWTQSWQRITPDVREVLEHLKAKGKVQVFGLSTHSRALAADAIRDGWNPVMVRHSAAHRKAEVEVFPHAIERGTSIITFNNTCYGRLLDAAVRPSDCFRYTLNTPGVSACFTAPSNLEYLEENLDALRNPALPDDVRERLLKRGEWMYREDTVFRKTVRADG